MKNNILLLVACCAASMQGQSIFRHDATTVQAQDGRCIDLSAECRPEQINLDYVPQHLMHIHDQAKKLPTTAYPGKSKSSYVKCTTAQQNAQAVELLIRNERLDQNMQKLSAGKQVVRFYRKAEPDAQAQWVPILTLSEQDAQQVLGDITVHPDGTLHL